MSLLKVAGTTASSGQLYVDDVFSTWLYTGNGSTQTITNGIDLAGKGGMVWIKSRSAATNNFLFDTSRGVNVEINSNTTDANATLGNSVTAFNSSGFAVGSAAGINVNAATYASWIFRKSAKFFDVQTVSHTSGTADNIDLSVLGAVGMVIAKNTTTTGDWTVWQRILTASNNLKLNTSAAQSTTNAWLSVSGTTATLAATAPTGTYVIYAYAHDTSSTGIIQCGSFTADASGNATVSLGWEPQYLLYKSYSNTASWNVFDTMRAWGQTAYEQLNPDGAFATTTNSGYNYSPTSTGFEFVNGGLSPNYSYIYMAIRRPNKPPTSGTQVFGLNARTGTGANATVTGGQTDDAVLIKNRGGIVTDLFSSRLTGTGYLITSSAADVEVAAGTTILQANPWDVMDGVKVGTTSNITNASADTFINYLFKRAPGFFDVVCYTGTGVARTVAHNLTVVPELIIVKNRSVAGYSWVVYDVASGNTKAMLLNTTGASTAYAPPVWNDTSPTATVFSVGTSPNNNTSGATYVAYLFATLAGISKVGSYTGNGTGQAIACGFSAGARFVLIKRTDSTGNWYTFDSARGLTSGSSPYLLLNSTAAETTGNNGVYASTGGFTLGSTASTTTNINGASYIYLSVA